MPVPITPVPAWTGFPLAPINTEMADADNFRGFMQSLLDRVAWLRSKSGLGENQRIRISPLLGKGDPTPWAYSDSGAEQTANPQTLWVPIELQEGVVIEGFGMFWQGSVHATLPEFMPQISLIRAISPDSSIMLSGAVDTSANVGAYAALHDVGNTLIHSVTDGQYYLKIEGERGNDSAVGSCCFSLYLDVSQS